jgi:glycosyltransferase involved in cell wall biosynthesis
MKILVCNHWLKKIGGSESYTFALIQELVRQSHSVKYFTFQKGLISDKIKDVLRVEEAQKGDEFDIALCSHHTTVDYVKDNYIVSGNIAQICHGVYPALEQPSANADKHISISLEVANHLAKTGIPSSVIHNGINLKRFRPLRKITKGKPKTILSLAHDEGLNAQIQAWCKKKNMLFYSRNKYKNGTWKIEHEINRVDIVVTLGRGAYESLACGRSVIVLDKRPYMDNALGDGLITKENLGFFLLNNCSGRYAQKKNAIKILDEAYADYHKTNTQSNRELAFEYFNIENQTKKILNYVTNNKKN